MKVLWNQWKYKPMGRSLGWQFPTKQQQNRMRQIYIKIIFCFVWLRRFGIRISLFSFRLGNSWRPQIFSMFVKGVDLTEIHDGTKKGGGGCRKSYSCFVWDLVKYPSTSIQFGLISNLFQDTFFNSLTVSGWNFLDQDWAVNFPKGTLEKLGF